MRTPSTLRRPRRQPSSQPAPSTRQPTVTPRNTADPHQPGQPGQPGELVGVGGARLPAAAQRLQLEHRPGRGEQQEPGADYAAADCTSALPHQDTAKTADARRPARRRARRSCGSAAAAAPSSSTASHSTASACRSRSRAAAPSPSSAGPTYPANAVTTMPGPVGFPRETVSPEVSECSRMPDSRRPLSSAATPCAPSWAIVTTCRATAPEPRAQPRPGAARRRRRHHGAAGRGPAAAGSPVTSSQIEDRTSAATHAHSLPDERVRRRRRVGTRPRMSGSRPDAPAPRRRRRRDRRGAGQALRGARGRRGRARATCTRFHRRSGTADLTLGEAVDQLRDAGHAELADRIDRELVGRNVLAGPVDASRSSRSTTTATTRRSRTWSGRRATQLVGGQRHLYEAEMKEDRRTDGLPGHEATPDGSLSRYVEAHGDPDLHPQRRHHASPRSASAPTR